MLTFRSPEIGDKQWITPYFENEDLLGAENAFGTMYIWQKAYRIQVCEHEGFFLRAYGENIKYYGWPLGKGDRKAMVEILINDAKERGVPFRMIGLSEEMKEELSLLFPDRFDFIEDRDAADYVYLSSDLANLSGKKYHGKRNHISKFERLYQWSFEPVTMENLSACREVSDEWCSQNGCNHDSGLSKERCAILSAFEHFEELGFSGGLIRAEGKPIAFTMGEPISDKAYVVHFEKALSEYTGSYTIINREFVKNCLTQYQYINREEDMGLEGLRKAKLSYYPAVLLIKYNAVLR